MRRHFVYILGILLILSVSHCAKRGTPTGGAKDSIPPVLIKATPPLNTTLFDEEKITLVFDEYIKLKDIATQLITSPPLEPSQYKISPETTVSKKIEIRLLDSLKPNVTYTFNFGSAIEDFNENNPLTFFSYTFSTGAIIDSLYLEGIVKDAFEKETEPFVSVHLYPIDSTFTDSTIYKRKPFYIANTLDSVYFKLQNISEGAYEMIAIQDVGKNYLFDQNIDKIGFFDEAVQLPRDSLKFPVLFKEIPNFDWARPQYINDHHIVFGYYGDPTGKDIELISEVPEDFKYLITKHTEQDSLDFWFAGIKEIDSLVFNLNGKDSIEQKIVKPV
ncbi:Ig-like domain-containing protein, partial [Flavobacteriaceae bacterium]|nr:Ig-like domain-containing protein [Flavobacteriaceae bacterium]